MYACGETRVGVDVPAPPPIDGVVEERAVIVDRLFRLLEQSSS